jgi:O-antigen biosynthesis protein
MSKLDLLNHPICFHLPDRLTDVPSWHEHIPFAMFLVEILRPGTIVELGTHAGDSYCAFCQAVSELGLETRCYAVDSWAGDLHSGFYGAEVLEDLRTYHDPRYGSFSSLIQSTFDDALQYFTDGSIDLLHIDGFHSYEAVKHDFESWLPKLSSKAVVILHDTNMHEREFGSGRYWEEIKHRYPHLEFLHGHGLGVLAIGKVRSEEFQALLEATDQELAVIRDFFFHLGHRLTLNRTIAAKESMVRERDSRLAERAADLAEREAELNHLRSTLTQLEQREQTLVEELRQERSILVARGYRFLRRLMRPKNQS